MSETLSTMMALGTTAPGFSLPDAVSGRTITPETFRGGKALFIAFTCNHCPYANVGEAELGKIGRQYGSQGVGMVAISSNDVGQYPEDGPAGMREMAKRAGFTFPYCHDETQETAKAYGAACTPDYFLFDGGG